MVSNRIVTIVRIESVVWVEMYRYASVCFPCWHVQAPLRLAPLPKSRRAPRSQPPRRQRFSCAGQDDDVRVTIESPEANQTRTAVGFVEGVMNCAAATAVMDMQVRRGHVKRGMALVGQVLFLKAAASMPAQTVVLVTERRLCSEGAHQLDRRGPRTYFPTWFLPPPPVPPRSPPRSPPPPPRPPPPLPPPSSLSSSPSHSSSSFSSSHLRQPCEAAPCWRHG